jgi:2-succinyl-5-enolpyruvyl-6-hydroxy-3-cyclohexene-1-carboxylate synthase
MNTAKKGVRLVAELCRKQGIRKVVFSPGSRSAPLVIAFTQISEIECLVIPDERVAGYFALGMAQQLNELVAVVCTSGTAVLNLSPAVCEAYYQKIPLTILTADRAEGAFWKGDNQAIRLQEKAYSPYTAFSLSVNGDANSDYELNSVKEKIEPAFQQMKRMSEPVHINVMMEEPLYSKEEAPLTKFSAVNVNDTYFNVIEQNENFKSQITNAKRKLIVVGMHHADNNFQKQIIQLAQRNDTVVWVEHLSNVHHSGFISNYDFCIDLLESNPSAQFLPDAIITIGIKILSKKFRQHFSKHPPEIHFDIPVRGQYFYDYFNKWDVDYLTELPYISEKDALEILLALSDSKTNEFKEKWLGLSTQGKNISATYLHSIPYSDLKVFETLIHSFPENANIQYGNSTPVRYSNFFDHKSSLTINANRGTSGIDGCLSTAAGAAYASKKLTVCVVGDISFFYDSNSLWNNYLSPNLRIIIINNGGGNIFRLLDGPKTVESFEKYFETQHSLNASHLASMYNLPYYICASQKQLDEALKTFYNESTKPKILEIKTDGELSASVYKNYFKQLEKKTADEKKKLEKH